MSRYAIVGAWSHESTVYAEDSSGTAYAVRIDTATLRDTRTNNDYREGAWKVSVTPRHASTRAKTFRGESAWSNATRYAGDAVTAIRYVR